MERAIKFLFTFLFVSVLAAVPSYADESLPVSTLITPQNVEFKTCTRTYILPAEKLFYMAIASVNANKFQIEEIQSKTGYILFTAVNKQYLASIVSVDSTHSMLKITPTNNNYFFPPGVVLNFFKYIDLYGSTPLVTLPKA
ncbi:unknown [Fusobacterium sp. CAG:439]|nr:unknown [Fusobacterium sp. CAG:439]